MERSQTVRVLERRIRILWSVRRIPSEHNRVVPVVGRALVVRHQEAVFEARALQDFLIELRSVVGRV